MKVISFAFCQDTLSPIDRFDDSKLYAVKQVAEPLEAHENFVWREIRKGHLRAVKLTAKFIRLRGQDVNAWLERGVTTLVSKSLWPMNSRTPNGMELRV